MESKASIKGHPIHPMLVPLPIGLLVGSLVADIVFLTVGGIFWYDMAWWTMAFGVVAALAAAIPGLIDYRARVRHAPRARAIARVHMGINLTVVAVYLLNLALRFDRLAADGPLLGAVVALSVLAIIALSISGWLGGEMVYRFGVGMSREDLRVSMLEAEEERARR